MRVGVFFQAGEPAVMDMVDRTVVVIDVLRATSTMVEALVNGAQGVYPAASTEEAIKLASSLGPEDTLLCGESKGLMIEGFDLGNSPREFTPDLVTDKRLIMSTTNGTRAFLMAEDADRVLACSFLNVGAVASAMGEAEEMLIVCAGREGRFAADDAVCAGTLLMRLQESHDGEIKLNDAAQVALELANKFRVGAEFLAMTDGGRSLVDNGFREDLDHCAWVDRYDVVPEMEDRVIQLRSLGEADQPVSH